MKSAILMIVLCLIVSVDAQALGETERDVLKGAAGLFVLQKIFEKHEEEQARYPGKYRPYSRFYCNKDEVTCAYERGVWERERKEYEEAKRRAYECGYTGRCE